jgi:hypothetical protein
VAAVLLVAQAVAAAVVEQEPLELLRLHQLNQAMAETDQQILIQVHL